MEVQPIRNKSDIKAIKKLLYDNKRNLFIFVLGINSGIRVGDLCKLKVNNFKNKKIGDSIQIKEGKTGKQNFITINKSIYKTFMDYEKSYHLKDDDYLFKSRKAGYSLHSNSVKRLIKSWCAAINLKGNYGCHTLRKTFGYHQRVHNGVGIDVLMKRFNHSSPSITLRYLGINDQEINDICMKDI